MKVTFFPKKMDNEPVTLILGSFDYIHNGHLELIKKAKEFDEKVALILIDNISKIKNQSTDKKINYIENKIQQLALLNIDYVTIINFDEKIKNMEPTEFEEKIFEIYNIKRIVVGLDYKYGRNGVGNFKNLDSIRNANIHILPILQINRTKISTSLIRDSIATGEFDLINKISPFPYRAKITVQQNIIKSWGNFLKPANGLYLALLYFDNVRYWGYCRITEEGDNVIYIDSFKWEKNAIDIEIEFIHLYTKAKKDIQWVKENYEVMRKDIANYLLTKSN